MKNGATIFSEGRTYSRICSKTLPEFDERNQKDFQAKVKKIPLSNQLQTNLEVTFLDKKKMNEKRPTKKYLKQLRQTAISSVQFFSHSVMSVFLAPPNWHGSPIITNSGVLKFIVSCWCHPASVFCCPFCSCPSSSSISLSN